MNTSGFYKLIDGELETGPTAIEGPGYTLIEQFKDTYTYPVDGWYWFDTYHEAYITLQNPPIVPIISNKKNITRLSFYNRLTTEELVTIDLASIGATPQAAMLRLYITKINLASFVSLENPEIISGLQTLEALGILAVGRSNIVLNTPTTPEEWA
jgi:hypothetical protein